MAEGHAMLGVCAVLCRFCSVPFLKRTSTRPPRFPVSVVRHEPRAVLFVSLFCVCVCVRAVNSACLILTSAYPDPSGDGILSAHGHGPSLYLPSMSSVRPSRRLHSLVRSSGGRLYVSIQRPLWDPARCSLLCVCVCVRPLAAKFTQTRCESRAFLPLRDKEPRLYLPHELSSSPTARCCAPAPPYAFPAALAMPRARCSRVSTTSMN